MFKWIGALIVLAVVTPAPANILPLTNRYVGTACRLRSGGRGVCTRITDCPAILNTARNGERNGLQGARDRCGFDRNIEVVCCDSRSRMVGNQNFRGSDTPFSRQQEDKGRPVREDKTTSTSREMKSVIACKRYSQECPQSVSPFITGGTVADVGEFPHMAALGYPISRNGMNISWLCGGTLISERYVLTAAHCALLSNRKPIVVRLGELDLSTNEDGANPVDYEIENVEIYPEFDANYRYHDLALVRLRKPVTFTKAICPACLYTENGRGRAVNNNEVFGRANGEEVGARVNDVVDLRQRILIISGWGNTEYLGDSSPILLKAVIKPFSVKECNDTLSRAIGALQTSQVPRGVNPDAMLCAGDRKGKQDTCQGDSGGPLQFIDKGSSLYTIIGITSFGAQCATPVPAIYTRVSSYVSWIEDKIW